MLVLSSIRIVKKVGMDEFVLIDGGVIEDSILIKEPCYKS
jgi:hypothetical protein